MKKTFRFLVILTVLIVCVTSLFACNNNNKNDSSSTGGNNNSSIDGSDNGNTSVVAPVEKVDYVANLTLDENSDTVKQKATVKIYIDGDTTHFNVPNSVVEGGILKARYLAIDTPESTGKVEAYGKTASNFTKEKLKSATSIILESDNSTWNADSTGSRYLVWVWYRTSESEPYRNLNLEILQNGLALASATGSNRYGDICVAALEQAKTLKYNIYSGKQDPNFFYGDAVELTLKELRCNIADYDGYKVAFEGIVTRYYNNGVYVENYDAETEIYFGIYVYYGATASGDTMELMQAGNELRIVGYVSEFQGSYQVSGVTYNIYRPNSPDNLQLISEGNKPSYLATSAETFLGKKTVELEVADEEDPDNVVVKPFEFDYANLVLATTISMKNLYVTSVYTTESDTSSDGAMTLTCTCDGKTISVRTNVLKDSNGNVITESAYKNKTINVSGVVEVFNGKYQIKALTASDITVVK